jgi:hypothetical protein
VDGNGRVKLHRLAQFMRNAATDYAIPRSKIAKARDAKFNSTEAVAELVQRAKRSFTDLARKIHEACREPVSAKRGSRVGWGGRASPAPASDRWLGADRGAG